jgi:hypothetical protein
VPHRNASREGPLKYMPALLPPARTTSSQKVTQLWCRIDGAVSQIRRSASRILRQPLSQP